MSRELGTSSEEFLAKTLATAKRLRVKGKVLKTISHLHQTITIPREKERKAQEKRREKEMKKIKKAAANMQNQ